MLKWPRRNDEQVASFLVQASYPAAQVHRTREQILVRHLLSRFQTDSTQEDEQTGRRTLFACAASAIPPIFAAVMLYPAYHPIAMPPAYRPYWSQIGDEYLYVLYAFVTMAVTSILIWETIFPDLLDVFALGVLPLAPRVLLRSRWKAVAFVIGLVLLCVSAPGALLLPSVAENSSFFRHFAAHGIAACTAGLSACAALLALQSCLEITFGTRRAKRMIPALQVGALFTVCLLLGNTPHLLDGLQRGAVDSRMPSVWFLGIYEQMKGGGPSAVWRMLAWRGWLTAALTVGAAALTYPRAYHRRTLYLVESGNAAIPGLRFPGSLLRFVHHTFVRSPGARATFHLIAQTAFRVSQVRTTLVIYVGIGLAVLLATSARTPARAVAIACCSTVLGCTNILRSQIMPRSAWVIYVLPKPQAIPYAVGSRAVVTLWTTIFALSVLSFLAFRSHAGPASASSLLIAFGAVLALPQTLTRLSMMSFRSFPFTDEFEATPESFVFAFLRNVFIIPCGVLAFGALAAKAALSASGVALWLLCMCCVAFLTRHIAEHPDTSDHPLADLPT